MYYYEEPKFLHDKEFEDDDDDDDDEMDEDMKPEKKEDESDNDDDVDLDDAVRKKNCGNIKLNRLLDMLL